MSECCNQKAKYGVDKKGFGICYESFIIIENSTKNKYIKNICREGKDRIRPLLNPTDIKYIEDKY